MPALLAAAIATNAAADAEAEAQGGI